MPPVDSRRHGLSRARAAALRTRHFWALLAVAAVVGGATLVAAGLATRPAPEPASGKARLGAGDWIASTASALVPQVTSTLTRTRAVSQRGDTPTVGSAVYLAALALLVVTVATPSRLRRLGRARALPQRRAPPRAAHTR